MMHPKYHQELRQFKMAAQQRCWATYREILGRLCQAHRGLGFTEKIEGFVRNQDFDGLVNYTDWMSEQKYPDAELHFSANQFAALVRKYPFPKDLVSFEPKKTAKEKWLKAEASCLETNNRFLTPLPSLEWSLHHMRGFISYVLGVEPELAEIFKRCDFGPGASLGVHGNATNKARKIASSWSVSPKALNAAYLALTFNFHLWEILLPDGGRNGVRCIDSVAAFQQFLSRVKCVQYNKIAFVPKTVKVERPIAVEPLLNGFVQKGIDLVMREKLARVGLDLTDQTPNQRLAREGSVDDCDDSFVTIDLSSASDSVSTEVVRNLIPPEWFRLLDGVRSAYYMDPADREIRAYHKFCSMGNGFCFPLETLIFAAACSAVGAGKAGRDFVVYGDDIILRKQYAEPLLSLLGDLGFTVNKGKTFLEGPFRESCGADWYQGEDVRPFTLDFALDSLESYFKFLNLTCRNERTTSFFAPLRGYLISQIPPGLRFCRVHDGNADSGYRVELDVFMASPFTKWHKNHQCWSWLELVVTPVQDDWRNLRDAHFAHVYAALSGASSEAPFTLRRKTRTNVRRVAYG
jgi:hypothetical protein